MNKNYNASTLSPYYFPSFGLNIKIPSDWQQNQKPQSINEIARFVPPQSNEDPSYRENLAIVGGMYEKNSSLNEMRENNVAALQELKKFQIIKMDQGFRLGNYPAYKIVYSFETNREPHWAMQVGTVLNSTYVMMTYNAQIGEYAKYAPTIEKILNSVKFTESSGNNLSQNGTMVTYKDPNNNFNLRYPSQWSKANQGYLSSDLTIYSPLNNASDRYYDNIRVFVNNSNMTLKGLLKQDQSSLKQLNDFRVLRETNTSLSGNPAYDVVYTFTVKDGQQNHKSERITSIINNKSYIILLDSTVEKFDSYVPSLRQIISSFEIPDPIEGQYYQSVLNSTLINRPSEGNDSRIK